MSKFIIDTEAHTCFPLDTFLDYAKQELEDDFDLKKREEMYEEIKDEIVDDITKGYEDRQEELVQDLDNAIDQLRGLESQAHDVAEAVEEAQSTNDRSIKASDFV